MAAPEILVDISTAAAGSASSASYADIGSLSASSIPVDGTGSVLLIIGAITPNAPDTSDHCADCQLTVDGSGVGPEISLTWHDGTGDVNGGSLAWAVTGLSAGNHSFSLQWITINGGHVTIDTSRERSLQVIEFTEDTTLEHSTLTAAAGSTATTSYVQIGGLTHTFAPASADSVVLLIANVQDGVNAGDRTATVQFSVGGTNEGSELQAVFKDNTNEESNTSHMYALTGDTASAAYAPEWITYGTGAQIDTTRSRSFQILEFTNCDLSSVEATTSNSAPVSYADILSMTRTITPDSTSSVVLSIGTTSMNDAGVTPDEVQDSRIAFGGTREGPELSSFSDTGSSHEFTDSLLAWAKTSLSGSQTISHMWQRRTATGIVFTTNTRGFYVLDLKAPAGGGRTTLNTDVRPLGGFAGHSRMMRGN